MNGIVLTCPACGTRYRSDAESIGPNGRTVRCARCGEVWFEPPVDVSRTVADPEALAHAENQKADDTVLAADMNDAVDDPPDFAQDEAPDVPIAAVSSPPPAPEPAFGQQTSAPPVQEPPESAQPVGADVLMRDRADQEKLARRRRTILFIWLVPLIIVLLAAIIAWTQRQAIVNRIPQMATLYQAIGADVRIGGLRLDPPVAQLMQEDGIYVLRIETTLHNLTGKAQAVPLIELTLHDEMGQALTQWYVEAAEQQIGPRARIDVSTDYASPPAGAVGVRYRLVGQDAAA